MLVFINRVHRFRLRKNRDSILTDEVRESLQTILTDICETYHYQIKAMEVMPDHIHLFVDCPQTVAPCDIVRTLKSISAIRLFQSHPTLKRLYARCGAVWSAGYFLSTVGHISEETVKTYIEEQFV